IVHDMIKKSLRAGHPVVGIGSGQWVLESHTDTDQGSSREENGLNLRQMAEGTLILVQDSSHVSSLAKWLYGYRRRGME
ncbi:MAG: hypothetical protein VB858_16170, partial [Planctomycetaceae bacterium]